MWAEARRVIERAERLHQRFFDLAGSAQEPCWEPPVDMVETDGALFIEIALPGVDPQRIEARFEGGILAVIAERDLRLPAEPAVIRRLELPHGRFERRVPLPDGRYALERQQLVNGCLQLFLRKLA
ncbi:MAG TPA: Hsp20/alpha crystallin family protein [Candidatus Angelobacter sp.]|nr:Hsp20/alpha crystallin family protein [Candidatus Angelobacter sp.]